MAPLREAGIFEVNDLDAAHDLILGRKVRGGGKRGGGECESRSTSKGASGGKKAARTKSLEEGEAPAQKMPPGGGPRDRRERRQDARERSCSRRRARFDAESKDELATDEEASANSEAENTPESAPNAAKKVHFNNQAEKPVKQPKASSKLKSAGDALEAEDPIVAKRRREREAKERAMHEQMELDALKAEAAAASAAFGIETPACFEGEREEEKKAARTGTPPSSPSGTPTGKGRAPQAVAAPAPPAPAAVPAAVPAPPAATRTKAPATKAPATKAPAPPAEFDADLEGWEVV